MNGGGRGWEVDGCEWGWGVGGGGGCQTPGLRVSGVLLWDVPAEEIGETDVASS